MVFTLVLQVHLMRNQRSRTGNVKFSNAAYHSVVNAFNFKPCYCRSHMLLFRLCLGCFPFNHCSSFLEIFHRLTLQVYCSLLNIFAWLVNLFLFQCILVV